jgi:hypothetical protein
MIEDYQRQEKKIDAKSASGEDRTPDLEMSQKYPSESYVRYETHVITNYTTEAIVA